MWQAQQVGQYPGAGPRQNAPGLGVYPENVPEGYTPPQQRGPGQQMTIPQRSLTPNTQIPQGQTDAWRSWAQQGGWGPNRPDQQRQQQLPFSEAAMQKTRNMYRGTADQVNMPWLQGQHMRPGMSQGAGTYSQSLPGLLGARFTGEQNAFGANLNQRMVNSQFGLGMHDINDMDWLSQMDYLRQLQAMQSGFTRGNQGLLAQALL